MPLGPRTLFPSKPHSRSHFSRPILTASRKTSSPRTAHRTSGIQGDGMNAFPRSGSDTSMAQALAEVSEERDFLPLRGTDHIEFYVGNARQAAYFYRVAFGMALVAYAGPETGQRDRASYVVQQGKIRFVLTTPLRSNHPIARHVHEHGDGVRVIALWVDDARQAWHETT